MCVHFAQFVRVWLCVCVYVSAKLLGERIRKTMIYNI